jgi:hypothetical protein
VGFTAADTVDTDHSGISDLLLVALLLLCGLLPGLFCKVHEKTCRTAILLTIDHMLMVLVAGWTRTCVSAVPPCGAVLRVGRDLGLPGQAPFDLPTSVFLQYLSVSAHEQR